MICECDPKHFITERHEPMIDLFNALIIKIIIDYFNALIMSFSHIFC